LFRSFGRASRLVAGSDATGLRPSCRHGRLTAVGQARGGAAIMAIVRVEVKPELLRWACERAGPQGLVLRETIPQLTEWIEGKQKPTLRQLEAFANKARVSVGYLFLPSPPDEPIPIRDLRTIGGQRVRRPSPDLLDVIYLCQRRQDWYHDYAE